jgi:hypothetical protein
MTDSQSPNPYVFVVGCQRSGTTLTERLLDAHPQIAMTHETRWIPEVLEQRAVTGAVLVEPELVAALVAHKRFPDMGISTQQVEQLVRTDAPRPYTTFVSTLFDLYGRERGKRLVGDKTPRYGRYIELLHDLWPKARFIHVIRDGRDVYASRKGMDQRRGAPRWREHPALSAGLWWTVNVRVARESGAALGPALYHELRYEALVDDPVKECAALCSFLDVPYEPTMLRFHQRTHHSRPANARSPRSRKRLPVTPGLRNWRSELSEDEVRQFEATGGDLLDELGYERSPLVPDERTLLEAAQVRDAFLDDMRRRGRPLPHGWDGASTQLGRG